MSVDSIIEKLVSRQMKTPVKLVPPPPLRGTVVTVARNCGAGGEEIAHLLAERLGLHCYNEVLLDAIAKRVKADPQVLARLDEHAHNLMEGWLRAAVTSKGTFTPGYRRALVNVVLGISHSGGVIVGRGANFILTSPNVFRVRVVCPLSLCVERVAKKEGVKLAKAEKIVLKTDKHRKAFLKEVYPSHFRGSSSYDLTLNTARLSYKQAVETILFTMQQLGFEVPEPHLVASEAAG